MSKLTSWRERSSATGVDPLFTWICLTAALQDLRLRMLPRLSELDGELGIRAISTALRLLQDAIEVDVTGSAAQQATLGGSDSSLEKNNVFGTEPKVYTGVSP